MTVAFRDLPRNWRICGRTSWTYSILRITTNQQPELTNCDKRRNFKLAYQKMKASAAKANFIFKNQPFMKSFRLLCAVVQIELWTCYLTTFHVVVFEVNNRCFLLAVVLLVKNISFKPSVCHSVLPYVVSYFYSCFAEEPLKVLHCVLALINC